MSRKLYYVEADNQEDAVKEVQEVFLENYQDYGGIVFKKKELITNLLYNDVFDTIYEDYNKNKIMFNFYSLDVIQEPEKQYEYDVENNNTFCINCIGCIYCNCCYECYNCFNCEDCENCEDCNSCFDCKNLKDCKCYELCF